MATELKTTLELDIKPFLDAIKRAANNLRVLEDLRPRLNVNELQRNVQTALNQIRGLNPQINVGLNIDTRELRDVENQINGVAEEPIRLDLLVNSEEIVTSLNRVRDLRQTAVSIPPQTKLDVDTNAEEVQTDIGKIKTDVTNLTSVNNVIKFSVEEGKIQQQIKAIEDSIKRSRDFLQGQTLPISLDIEPPTGEAEQRQEIERLKKQLTEIDSIVATPDIKVSGLDVNVEKALQSLTLTEEALKRIENLASSGLGVQNTRDAFIALNEKANVLGTELDKLGTFEFSEKGFLQAADALEELQNKIQEINKLALKEIFPDVDKKLLDAASAAGTFDQAIQEVYNLLRKAGTAEFSPKFTAEGLDRIETQLKQFQQTTNTIGKEGIRIQAELIGGSEVVKRIQDLRSPIQRNLQEVIDSASKAVSSKVKIAPAIKIDTQTTGVPKTINELNKVEKETNDIPRNVKINVDSTGTAKAAKDLGGASGFAGQLGSGLLAAFSGAAIGAAIANFASQAVRAIVSAADKADELNDKLSLAFTQAGQGVTGFNLDRQLENANTFALDLGENFGISITRSKELLAQVVGLTGEFGATSEAITKASIGIEEATGGLVKAETAAKLFSRSIGNPEDQAALETLAKRFPAIGAAIQGATDPAEKANAVLTNLTGTFTALEEKSRGFGEQFQLLSEVAFGTFATALVPIFDAFVPLLEALRKLITDNAGAIAEFGKNVVDNFVNPLVDQLLAIGPDLFTYFEGFIGYLGTIGSISFDVLISAIQLLSPIFAALGNIVKTATPFLQELGNVLNAVLAPIITSLVPTLDSFNQKTDDSTGFVGLFKDGVVSLNPLLETLGILVKLATPLVTALGRILADVTSPAVAEFEDIISRLILPFRVFNFLFDEGAKFAEKFGLSIDSINDTLTVLGFNLLKLLGPLGGVIANLSGPDLLTNAITKPANVAVKALADLNKGLTSTQKLTGAQLLQRPLTGAELLSTGVVQPTRTRTVTGGGETKKIKEEESELQKLIKAYESLAKVVEATNALRTTDNELIIRQQEEAAGRNLTNLEKIRQEQLKIIAQQERQVALETSLGKLLGKSGDELKTFGTDLQGIVRTYLQTGDLSVFPIKFNAKDPKSVEEAQRFAETAIKLVQDRIAIQSAQSQFNIQLNQIQVELDRDVISTQLGLLQEDIQRQLTGIELGNLSIEGFDIEGVRNSLIAVRTAAETSLKPFEERLKASRAEVAGLTERLNVLRQSGQTNTEEFKNVQKSLRIAVDALNVLDAQTKEYRQTVDSTNDTLNNLGNTLEDAISARLQRISTQFERLADRQEFQITVGLNADGVRKGLIEIEKNFARSVNAIQQQFAQIEARLRAEQNVPVGPILQTEKLAKAQKEALRTIAAENIIAIRQFKLQNDAVFALTEALANNLGQAFVPNTLDARRGLNERQKQIDSQLELLRANLEAELQLNKDNLQLRTLSYQEYTEKVLELEKQKSESIKQYEEEVSQARLQALQRIAEEALPAIQNQLQLANAELTVLFQDSAASFEEVANKGLETIGLVAAQSLALALQQAKSLEDVQRLFLRNIVSGLLRVLRVQLEAAIIGALFTEVQQKSFAGLVTGAIISGILVGLFAAAEAKILASIGGFESGGYTGNGGTKEVAGVVHGQEFVVNASGTKGNRELLEWINKGKSAESFFDRKPNELNVNNFVDTKALNASINGLAYTMDARLSSMERTLDSAITKNAMTVRTANQVDVSVYSDPGTAIKYMKKMGKIKGLT